MSINYTTTWNMSINYTTMSINYTIMSINYATIHEY